MKVPMYDSEPMVKVTLTLSPRAHEWLSSDRGNMARLREILDRKLGTETKRRNGNL